MRRMLTLCMGAALALALTGAAAQAAGKAPIARKPALRPVTQNLSAKTLALVARRGTAGMPLSGGRKVVVQGRNLMIRSKKGLSPLVPKGLRTLVAFNRSSLNTRQLQGPIASALKLRFKSLADRSYAVRTSISKETRRGALSDVTVDLVFLHRDQWLAEHRTMVLSLAKSSKGLVLKKAAPRAVAKRAQPRLRAVAGASNLAKAKRRAVKLKPVPAKYATLKPITAYAAMPIAKLIPAIRFVPIGPTAKALANTAYPEVVTAKDATDQVALWFQLFIGQTAKLATKASSNKAAILNYLKNAGGLQAWNNIGHGGPDRICQGDGDILHTDLPTSSLARGICGCVCLVNSCQTFNNPLKAQILAHHPRTYIAGILNLPMVTSEGSNPVFWSKVLWWRKPMSVAFTETNAASGLTGYWGFHGDGGTF